MSEENKFRYELLKARSWILFHDLLNSKDGRLETIVTPNAEPNDYQITETRCLELGKLLQVCARYNGSNIKITTDHDDMFCFFSIVS